MTDILTDERVREIAFLPIVDARSFASEDEVAALAQEVLALREESDETAALVKKLEGVALCMSAAMYYGGWKAETLNERELQAYMESAGYWPTTEDEIIARRALLSQNGDNND